MTYFQWVRCFTNPLLPHSWLKQTDREHCSCKTATATESPLQVDCKCSHRKWLQGASEGKGMCCQACSPETDLQNKTYLVGEKWLQVVLSSPYMCHSTWVYMHIYIYVHIYAHTNAYVYGHVHAHTQYIHVNKLRPLEFQSATKMMNLEKREHYSFWEVMRAVLGPRGTPSVWS